MSVDPAVEEAAALDAEDALSHWRHAFALPRNARGEPLTYLCGHSLGLAPLAARTLVEEELTDWETLGVLGHERSRRPWVKYAEQLQEDLALLAGAQRDEVVAMSSLSVNLHLLLAGFYRPTAQRHRILIEAGAFSSDRHVVASQLQLHGFDPATSLIELAPRAGEDVLRIEDIEACIAAQGEQLALVLWPGVQYRTGQGFDLKRIATAAHAQGALLCADLAHAIGNTPLALHADAVDCAAWCSYKYLNGGPGAIGGLFVHQRHADRPHYTGWWGHDLSSRFRMGSAFQAAAGAASWQLSNPPVLATAPLLASLALFRAAGLAPLRQRSVALTGFLERQLRRHAAERVQIVTPADPAQRGAQLSVRIVGTPAHARTVFDGLIARGVVADWREPDIIRLAPVPLYNSFADAQRAASALAALP